MGEPFVKDVNKFKSELLKYYPKFEKFILSLKNHDDLEKLYFVLSDCYNAKNTDALKSLKSLEGNYYLFYNFIKHTSPDGEFDPKLLNFLTQKNGIIKKYPKFENHVCILQNPNELEIFTSFITNNSNNKELLDRLSFLDDCEFEEFISLISNDENYDVKSLFEIYSSETRHTITIKNILQENISKDILNEKLANPNNPEWFKNLLLTLDSCSNNIAALHNKLKYHKVTYDQFLNDYQNIIDLRFYSDMCDDVENWYMLNTGYNNMFAWLRTMPKEYKESEFNKFNNLINDIRDIKKFVASISNNLPIKTIEDEDTIAQVISAKNIEDLEKYTNGIENLVTNYYKQSILNISDKKQLNFIKEQLNELILENTNCFLDTHVNLDNLFFTRNDKHTYRQYFVNFAKQCVNEIDNHPKNQSLITKLKNKFNKDTGRV